MMVGDSSSFQSHNIPKTGAGSWGIPSKPGSSHTQTFLHLSFIRDYFEVEARFQEPRIQEAHLQEAHVQEVHFQGSRLIDPLYGAHWRGDVS